MGDRRHVHGVEWLVVGNFDLGRSFGSCDACADANTVLSALGGSHYNEVNVMLRSPASFDELINATKDNPQLRVIVAATLFAPRSCL